MKYWSILFVLIAKYREKKTESFKKTQKYRRDAVPNALTINVVRSERIKKKNVQLAMI